MGIEEIESWLNEGRKCLVFPQTGTFHEILRQKNNENVIFYPERSMTFYDTVCYRPYVKSVITENPYIISCYSRSDVVIFKDGVFQFPDRQTYGCSVDILVDECLGYGNSIPLAPIGGLDGIAKFRNEKGIASALQPL